jgi:large subunit ribosomal protein L29
MKQSELKEKSDAELSELAKSLRGELFQSRLQNFTNQLDDTSSIPKKRRELARVLTEQRHRELAALTAGVQQALTQESA